MAPKVEDSEVVYVPRNGHKRYRCFQQKIYVKLFLTLEAITLVVF